MIEIKCFARPAFVQKIQSDVENGSVKPSSGYKEGAETLGSTAIRP